MGAVKPAGQPTGDPRVVSLPAPLPVSALQRSTAPTAQLPPPLPPASRPAAEPPRAAPAAPASVARKETPEVATGPVLSPKAEQALARVGQRLRVLEAQHLAFVSEGTVPRMAVTQTMRADQIAAAILRVPNPSSITAVDLARLHLPPRRGAPIAPPAVIDVSATPLGEELRDAYEMLQAEGGLLLKDEVPPELSGLLQPWMTPMIRKQVIALATGIAETVRDAEKLLASGALKEAEARFADQRAQLENLSNDPELAAAAKRLLPALSVCEASAYTKAAESRGPNAAGYRDKAIFAIDAALQAPELSRDQRLQLGERRLLLGLIVAQAALLPLDNPLGDKPLIDLGGVDATGSLAKRQDAYRQAVAAYKTTLGQYATLIGEADLLALQRRAERDAAPAADRPRVDRALVNDENRARNLRIQACMLEADLAASMHDPARQAAAAKDALAFALGWSGAQLEEEMKLVRPDKLVSDFSDLPAGRKNQALAQALIYGDLVLSSGGSEARRWAAALIAGLADHASDKRLKARAAFYDATCALLEGDSERFTARLENAFWLAGHGENTKEVIDAGLQDLAAALGRSPADKAQKGRIATTLNKLRVGRSGPASGTQRAHLGILEALAQRASDEPTRVLKTLDDIDDHYGDLPGISLAALAIRQGAREGALLAAAKTFASRYANTASDTTGFMIALGGGIVLGAGWGFMAGGPLGAVAGAVTGAAALPVLERVLVNWHAVSRAWESGVSGISDGEALLDAGEFLMDVVTSVGGPASGAAKLGGERLALLFSDVLTNEAQLRLERLLHAAEKEGSKKMGRDLVRQLTGEQKLTSVRRMLLGDYAEGVLGFLGSKPFLAGMTTLAGQYAAAWWELENGDDSAEEKSARRRELLFQFGRSLFSVAETFAPMHVLGMWAKSRALVAPELRAALGQAMNAGIAVRPEGPSRANALGDRGLVEGRVATQRGNNVYLGDQAYDVVLTKWKTLIVKSKDGDFYALTYDNPHESARFAPLGEGESIEVSGKTIRCKEGEIQEVSGQGLAKVIAPGSGFVLYNDSHPEGLRLRVADAWKEELNRGWGITESAHMSDGRQGHFAESRAGESYFIDPDGMVYRSVGPDDLFVAADGKAVTLSHEGSGPTHLKPAGDGRYGDIDIKNGRARVVSDDGFAFDAVSGWPVDVLKKGALADGIIFGPSTPSGEREIFVTHLLPDGSLVAERQVGRFAPPDRLVADREGNLAMAFGGPERQLVSIPDPDGALKSAGNDATTALAGGHRYLVFRTMVDGRPTPRYFELSTSGDPAAVTPVAKPGELPPMQVKFPGCKRVVMGDSSYALIDDPDAQFVYGIRETAESHGPRAGSAQELDATASNMAIFVSDEQGGLRPAPIPEVRAHFRQVVGEPRPKNWKTLPRADKVEVAPHQVRFRRGKEVLTADIGPRPEGGKFPNDAQLQTMLADLPFQALRELHHIRFGFRESAVASFDLDGTLLLHSNEGWLSGAEMGRLQTTTVPHEVAGHGIEKSDPRVLGLLMQARILDAQAGAEHGTDRGYGDHNLWESYSVGVEEYKLDPYHRAKHGYAAELMDFIWNDTGAPTDYGSLQQGLLAALIPLLIMPAASRAGEASL